jgi:hypothetical protein
MMNITGSSLAMWWRGQVDAEAAADNPDVIASS